MLFFILKRRELTEKFYNKHNVTLESEISLILIRLKEIIQDPNYNKCINVFKMNTEGCGTDIEHSILNALSKGILRLIFLHKLEKDKKQKFCFLSKRKNG